MIAELKRCVENADYDKGLAILKDLENSSVSEALYDDPEYAILRAAVLFQVDDEAGGMDAVLNGLKHNGDNYELYYTQGEYFLRKRRIEDAYACFHAAFFWGRESDDKMILAEAFFNIKDNYRINDHKMNVALADLIRQRLDLSLYEDTFLFLKWIFFEIPSDSKHEYISEETMLQFIMIEATLTEKNHMDSDEFDKYCTLKIFDNDYKNFLTPYIEVKHAVRRIWFDLPAEDKCYLTDVIARYNVSADLLAVITKYSVSEDSWKDVFERTAIFLRDSGCDLAQRFAGYAAMIGNITSKPQKKFISQNRIRNDLTFERIYLDESSVPVDEEFLAKQEKDERSLAVIFCTNDEMMEKECLLYLGYLKIPEEMKLKVYSVWNARGMCYGYNRAMRLIDAKYKMYIHHDTFFIKDDCLCQIMDQFKDDMQWKMLGIAGSLEMTDKYFWAGYDFDAVRFNLYQDRGMETILSKTIGYSEKVEKAAAIDGILIATCDDLPWREDVFDQWHFYDISQCYEFTGRGLLIGLINDDEPWMLHETTTKRDSDERYEYYGEIFSRLYLSRQHDM